MSTFLELKTSISKRLLDPTYAVVSAADVGIAINDAIDYWKQRRFWFNETTATAVLVVGNPAITMPSDFLFEIPEGGFVINYSSSRYKLEKVNLQQYQAQNVEGNGLPYIYTYKGGSWIVYFFPDQAYNLEITYVKNYTDLSDDNDENDFTTEATRLIEYEALSRLSAELRQDEKMEAYYSSRAKNEANNLFNRSNKVSATGTLTIDSL